ncbi:peptidase S28, partial [Kipferlia bialata]|eukprot:g8129.t1
MEPCIILVTRLVLTSSQLVDHFDKTNTATWSQKFYVNDTFYSPGGPVLFFLGGEGPESPKTLSGSFYINTFAEELGALMIAIEHRYYGESMPVDDLSNDNMVYLSSAQALADCASFRAWFPTAYSMYSTTEDAAWIALGGSYSGNLAAWLRLRYPHLIAGALASSAPVEATVDNHMYYDVVQASLSTSSYGQQCPDALAEAIETVELMVGHESGRMELAHFFHLCMQIDAYNPSDVSNFMAMLDDPIA